MTANARFDSDGNVIFCQGDWDIANIPKLESFFQDLSHRKLDHITINGQDIQKMDSAGAWLLTSWAEKFQQKKIGFDFEEFSQEHLSLLQIVNKIEITEEKPLPVVEENWMYSVGKYSMQQLTDIQQYLGFIGLLTLESFRILANPYRLRWAALSIIIFRTGFLALPIIALLSFMIGVVITYQMGLQLRNYGANMYIVDLLGIAILREFGPLLTAIMLAGRTGSSYTAQLGIMKINQEIDALNTMGVTPAELLLIPRIVGLILVLPLLTMWSDIFGVLGGMVMANSMLDLTWYDFLHRFPHAVKLKNLLIGLGKAPVFAFLIATIGCFEGMQVRGSADSVGQNTTRSVVLAIFFIIVADAAFSIIFSKMQL